MRHLDLFSGIGGFAYAVDKTWPNTEHIFCDNDPFCQEVLKRHWPEAPIVSDIRRFTFNPVIDEHRPESREIREADGVSKISRETLDSWRSSGTDLLTGGFPCQPFSQAGRRRGTADDRYLWPEMFRVIQEFKPRWVIAENVRGLVTWNEGMVLEQVCTDLESEGYEVQPLIIPAVAVNAPHRRDRVWIIAHCKGEGGSGLSERKEEARPQLGFENSDAPDTTSKILEGGRRGKSPDSKSSRHSGGSSWEWNQNWIEVATRLCRVDDGLPRRLDRNPRLKALGNAIVPQVAEEIMRAIKYIMENEN